MRLHGRQHGFTLIEMLVVFAVFALIGMISSRILSSVIDNQKVVAERGARLAEVQRAMHILQRDIMQFTQRPVRDQLGDPLEPLLIGADGLMEFTRLGWRNPLAQRRADVQRLAYVAEDGTLYRAYWPVLDRTPDTEPVRQELLTKVEQIEFFAVDAAGNEHSFWPTATAAAGDPNTKLAAVLVRLDLPPFGPVERLWPVVNP